jgi:hypothetical protein
MGSGALVGHKVSAITRKKLAAANRGKKASETTRERLRNKVISVETRQKISLAHKGSTHKKWVLPNEKRLSKIMQKVYPEPNTGCWLWAGATLGSTGYGRRYSANYYK